MSKATPTEEWALDHPNDTGVDRTIKIVYEGRFVYIRVSIGDDEWDSHLIDAVLSPDQARALATLLLYAADKTEGKV